MIRPEARLADRQRAANQRLGFDVARLHLEQNGEPIEKPRRRLGDCRLVRVLRNRERVRRERIENRPASHVLRIANERRVHPPQRLPQRLAAPRFAHAPPREILHQSMHGETVLRRLAGLDRRARDERIGEEVGARGARVEALGIAGRGDVEQRVGDRLRREKGEAFEQAAGVRRQAVDRGRPGRGEARVVVVAHQRLVEPVEHGRALVAPQFEIAREADALGRDVGARLFQPERQAAEFAGELLRQLGVVGRARAILVGALQQERDGGRPYRARRVRACAAKRGNFRRGR